MNYIKFNDYQCELIGFNKYTNYDENGMVSSCNCQVATSDVTGLQEVGLNGISSIQILHDNEVIYNLTNINARISSINETLAEDHIDITLSINF